MNLDLIPNGAIKRVHVSQNDVGRTLTFELFNNSTSYTVPSGATVKIQGTKPSGFGFSETCTVNGNVATIDTTEAMTDESGNIQTELSISYGDVVIGTSNFVLAVEKNPHPSNTTDGTQITAQSLQVQINELADIIESGGSGLTDDIKQALLDCFEHVAWIDDDGQDYYDALESALYPPANLTSISCVYTQSGTVYDTDSLDSLKSDLVVTAHYDNSTTQTVTSYTLSGTLTVGTSTITVSYGGKTTTFNVTVTQSQINYSYYWDLTNSLTDNIANQTIQLLSYQDVSNATRDANGLTFDDKTQIAVLGDSISLVGKTIELDIANFDFKGNADYHVRLLMTTSSGATVGTGALIYRSGLGWSSYGFQDSTNSHDGTSYRQWSSTGWGSLYADGNINAFNNKTIKIVFNSDGHTKSLYSNGTLIATMDDVYFNGSRCEKLIIGGLTTYSATSGDQCYDMTITGIRIYENE